MRVHMTMATVRAKKGELQSADEVAGLNQGRRHLCGDDDQRQQPECRQQVEQPLDDHAGEDGHLAQTLLAPQQVYAGEVPEPGG